MINLSQYATLFADSAKRGFDGRDVIFITAYPNVSKPSLLKSAVASFSVYDVETQTEGLGSEFQAGQIKVQASIYVPYRNKTENPDGIAEKICTVICSEFNIAGVKITKTEPDEDTECLVKHVIFTIDDEVIKE